MAVSLGTTAPGRSKLTQREPTEQSRPGPVAPMQPPQLTSQAEGRMTAQDQGRTSEKAAISQWMSTKLNDCTALH